MCCYIWFLIIQKIAELELRVTALERAFAECSACNDRGSRGGKGRGRRSRSRRNNYNGGWSYRGFSVKGKGRY